VIIADDQALVRAGLKMILDVEDDIQVVAEAGDGLSVVRAAATTAADVILMDIRMPGIDGIEATRRILGGPGNAPGVLVLTTLRTLRTPRSADGRALISRSADGGELPQVSIGAQLGPVSPSFSSSLGNSGIGLASGVPGVIGWDSQRACSAA
jgi:CheY-like chemotaxis protein